MRTLSASLCLVLAIGCGRGEEPPSPGAASSPTDVPRAQLREVHVPDLAGAERGLQERVRMRYASLIAAREQPNASDAQLAAAYGEVGKLLIAAEFLIDAEPFLLNAHTLAPRDMAWLYYLGHLQRLRGQPDKATPFFERALTIEPDYVPALVWLGALHLDAGRPEAAASVLEKAVALQPRSAAAQFGRGRAALAAGDATRAVNHLQAALASDPQALPVHYPLAMAYRALGDQRRAQDHLSRWKEGQVLPDDPLMADIGESLQTAVGYEVRGTRALDARNWGEAAAMFRKGLEVAPRDATLHQNLGTALFLGGDATGAIAEFEEAARLSPGYAKAHFAIGVLMDASGRDAESIARFSEAVRYDPQMADARFSLAEALRRTGQVEASLAHYDAIVKADPSASQARFGYAMALVRLGRYPQARAALEEAVKAHPDQPGLPHALARVLAAAPDDSVRDGRRALALAEALHTQYGSNAALLETMAMALAEVGRFKEAAGRQREAIGLAVEQRRNDVLPAMRDSLRRYESGMPSPAPWPEDDPVHRPRASGEMALTN